MKISGVKKKRNEQRLIETSPISLALHLLVVRSHFAGSKFISSHLAKKNKKIKRTWKKSKRIRYSCKKIFFSCEHFSVRLSQKPVKQNLKYRLIPPANRARQAIESILPSSVQISERYTLPWCIPPLLRSVHPLLLRLWLVNQWTISPSLSPWSTDYCNKWFSLSEFLSLSLSLFPLPQSSLFFFPVYSWLFFFTSSCGWGRMSRDILSPGRSRRQ